MANQSQSATAKAKESSSVPVPIHRENSEGRSRLNDEVSRLAYSLYEQDGNTGNELAHWFAAESQILQRIPEIRESSSWYTVNIPLRGFTAEQINVTVEPSRALIVADRAQGENQTNEKNSTATSARESIYLMADWPSDVDPATASAYLKNETLTLTVKRANPSTQSSVAE